MDIDPELLEEDSVLHTSSNVAPSGFPASGSAGDLIRAITTPQDDEADSDAESEESDMEMDQDGNLQLAKTQDEDNLDKLIHSVFRGGSRSSMLDPMAQAGVLGEAWDQSIKDVLDDLEQEDDRQNTQCGQKRKRKHRNPRAHVVLSTEVQSMLSAANSAYMTREYDSAVELLQEIIRIEPAARPAYHTLSAIHTELGNHDKSLQLDILAAHLAGKAPDLWKDLGARSRDAGLLQQAVYCFTQALSSVDTRDDVDALWDRSILLVDLGELKKAISGFSALLKLHPNDPTIVRQMVPVLIQQGEHVQALDLLADAFADQVQRFPDGPSTAPPTETLLDISDLRDLVALQKHQNQYKDAIRIIRTGQRWLQGRATLGQAWELYSDDREYDLSRKSRPHWEQEERLRWLEDLPLAELDPHLRGGLAACRLQAGNKAETDLQTQIIRDILEIHEYPDVYTELADAYFDEHYYEQASELYMDLAECDITNVPAVWSRLAQCCKQLGDLEKARLYFSFVIQSDASNLDVKLQLAEVFDELGDRGQALELVNEVLEGRRLLRVQEAEAREQQAHLEEAMQEDADAVEATLFPERARRKKRNKRKLTREQRREAENERMGDIEIGLDRLKRIEKDLADPLHPYDSKDWLDAASFLVDSFRETPAFFPMAGKRSLAAKMPNRRPLGDSSGRNLDQEADALAHRIRSALAEEGEDFDQLPSLNTGSESWCGLNFDEWFKLAIRYACALTIHGNYPEAVEVLQHVRTSAIAKEGKSRVQAVLLGLAVCAYHAGDYEQATLELRRILRARGQSTEMLRTIQTLFASGHQAWSGWSNNNMQKFILRTIKMFDIAANASGKNPTQSSPGPSGGGEDEDLNDEDDDEDDANDDEGQDTFKRTKVDPYFLAQYANVMLGARGYSSAIFYYLRLLDVFPNEPLFHFLTGCAYLLRSIQRQVDNRHYAIAQAFACFSQYRKLRQNEAEANYNFGRAFQTISLNSLAIRHYEAVLSEERSRKAEHLEPLPNGLAKYAAYNLYLLYLTSGVGALAKQISDEWLSF